MVASFDGSSSPHRSAIVFGGHPRRFGDGEIRLLDPDGNNSRKLDEIDEHSSIPSVLGSPEGESPGLYAS